MELLNLIHALTEKIDVMNHKIDTIDTKLNRFIQNHNNKKNTISNPHYPDYTPYHDFYTWIENFQISQYHVNLVFRSTILEGCKHFIQDTFKKSDKQIPIILVDAKPKIIYVFIPKMIANNASFAERPDDATQNSDSLSRIPKGNSSTNEVDISNSSELRSSEVFLEDSVVSYDDINQYPSGEWTPLNEKIIHTLIESMWRKMLEFYYTSDPEPGVNETTRDINKKKLIDMRKGLVERHTKEIERFIIKIIASLQT